MWADSAFACDIHSFLTRMREEDNDYLRREIDALKTQCKEFKNRYVPKDDEQQWIYMLSYKIDDNTVHFYFKYRLMNDEDYWMKDLKVKGLREIYHVSNLPNGCTFRSTAYELLASICEKYGGSSEGRHYFTIPLKKWKRCENVIQASIRLQMKQVRIDLGWRTDLDDLNNE